MSNAQETVSVLVCTRTRPEMLLRLLRSLLVEGEKGGPPSSLEVIVADQSDGSDSAQAIAGAFGGDSRMRVIRSARRGKGGALNEGLAAATGEILVCTDDDCEAPPGWATQMTLALKEHVQAAVLFCQVAPGTNPDPSEGYIPAFQPLRSRSTRSASFGVRRFGLGAGMAVRANAVRSLGGFDEAFGPGGLFPSCDDTDIALRALLRGWHVLEEAEVAIVHHGFRSMAEGRAHARRDWVALGAVCAKPLRAGYWSTFTLGIWVFLVDAVWPPCFDLVLLRRPRGLTRVVSFVQGYFRGLRTPVEPKNLKFIFTTTHVAPAGARVKGGGM